jgi:hypothetical protein
MLRDGALLEDEPVGLENDPDEPAVEVGGEVEVELGVEDVVSDTGEFSLKVEMARKQVG